GPHLGPPPRPVALRDLRALPRDLLPTRRGAVGYAVLAARDGSGTDRRDALRDAKPLRALRPKPGRWSARQPESGRDGRDRRVGRGAYVGGHRGLRQEEPGNRRD